MLKKLFKGLFYISIVLILSGCIDLNNDSGENIQKEIEKANGVLENVEYIQTFYAAETGNSLKFTLVFADSNRNIISPNGNAKLKIYDDNNNKIYENEFLIDFKNVGESSRYVLEVFKEDISKGMTDKGYAEVIFTSKEGKTISKDTRPVNIPYYSEEELLSISEEEYIKNSVLGIDHDTLDDVKITVLRSGYYTTYGKTKKTVFRVDLEVENKYGQAKDFTPSDIYITDESGAIYKFTSGGTLSGISKIPALDKVQGYWLFENVVEDSKSKRILFKNGRISSGWVIFDLKLE
ncbi:conserved hypothetical protein [Methanococcus vannielii SB]|uniref:DUF4352 domain-containing protein n=1 Tax=Methanococcus vannielii (strain ATCC 35089 / DSM 1224 / JCM 13029 / OCM 148 / SB) TaxID=406327 RepID=A6URX9_METVS|nr:hypothetical protein [Methanococcus vannielii]ABR55251.1 conserved hypothetical protein [Methanococcus vannielii SB]